MPAQAILAVGPALMAIDTDHASVRKTLTEFPARTSIDWLSVDRPHGRVFVGVTSGCDPGVNGMYVVPLGGGSRRRIALAGNRASVSPDGTKIAYSVHTDGCGATAFVVQDLASGHQQHFPGPGDTGVGGWTSDGKTLFLTSYGDNNIYRFGPIADGPSPDFSKPWDHGIATDAGGRRVAILDWCANDAVECVVGVRTRCEDNSGPDYTFGAMKGIESMSIDATGQWPLLVVDRQNEQVVFMFANGAWHELAHGNAADW